MRVPALVALALPAVAPAAPVIKGAPTFHDRFVEDFVDDDFCEAGESVSIHIEGRETVWEREGAFKLVTNVEASFTHEGPTLVAMNAGRLLAIVVPARGEPRGPRR